MKFKTNYSKINLNYIKTIPYISTNQKILDFNILIIHNMNKSSLNN